ncbi:MAG TPA: HAD family hydrolase [Armatimonadota bacterium]
MAQDDPRQPRLLVADLDGTLVTPEKALTARSRAAVAKLHDAGILFTITSGRPPRGMRMVIDKLRISAPLSAFNGAVYFTPDLSVLEAHYLPETLVGQLIDRIGQCGLDAWVYQGEQWLIRTREAPHVEREAYTVQFDPTVVSAFTPPYAQVSKIVGVSDDHAAVVRCVRAIQDACGDRVSASRSQPYYMDVTHPAANKGVVIQHLAETLHIPPASIATIGDMPSDVLMFKQSGFRIAMGNAADEVKGQADYVTTANSEEGFANAVEQYLLPLVMRGNGARKRYA